jgi:hypothetical protein
MIVESLTPRPGIREQNRPIPEVAKVAVGTCVSLHASAHAGTGGFPAYGFAFANPGDDAVGFFDAATAVHENFGT